MRGLIQRFPEDVCLSLITRNIKPILQCQNQARLVRCIKCIKPTKGMLNASVKELENQVFNFHSIVAEKTADLTAVSDDNSYVKARYINSKQRRVS
jgi:hypothetical protein